MSNIKDSFVTPISVTDGGLSGTSLTANFVLIGNGSSAPSSVNPGSSGNILTSDGTFWTSAPGPTTTLPTLSLSAKNLGLSITANAGSLNIALKQADGLTDPSTGNGAVTISIRSSTAASAQVRVRSITSSLALNITVSTTLGMIANADHFLWIYLIDTDGNGTMALGASTVRYDENSLQTCVNNTSTVTVTLASPAVFTQTAHSLVNQSAFTVSSTGILPTGLTAAGLYYANTVAANTFRCSTTVGGANNGGANVNTSGTQTGVLSLHIADWHLVSNTTSATKPIRLIGRAVFNLPTPGVWIAPKEVSVAGQAEYPPERISVNYGNNVTTTITSGGSAAWAASVRMEDTHNSWTPGLATFLAPSNGTYLFSLSMLTANITYAVSGFTFVQLSKNTTTGGVGTFNLGQLLGQRVVSVAGEIYVQGTLPMVQGDFANVFIYNTGGNGATKLNASTADNYITVTKIA